MAEQELMTAAAGQKPRTLAAIGSEIREHAARMEYHMKGTIWEAVEIGRRLTEARDQTAHGEWMDFLRRETPFSYDKARNLIRVFEAYGERQADLLGDDPPSNSETYRNLSFSQALELLALPTGEREAFAAEKNVEDMSVRELREAIRERDEARKALEEEKKASEGAALRIAETESERDAALEELDAAREEADRASRTAKLLNDGLERERERADTAEAMLDQVRESAAKAEADASTAENSRAEMEQEMRALKDVHEGTLKELEDLRNRPVDVAVQTVVDEDALEAARQEVRSEMQEKLDASEKQVSKLQKAQETLRTSTQNKITAQGSEIDRLKAELKEVRGQLKQAEKAARNAEKPASGSVEKESPILSDGDLATFNECFNEAQTLVNRMRGILLKVRGKNPETAVKLGQAVLALAEAVKGVAEA